MKPDCADPLGESNAKYTLGGKKGREVYICSFMTN